MSATPTVNSREPATAADLLHAAQALAPEDRKRIAEETMRQLPSTDQKDIAATFRPGRAMTDWIWLIVVSSFAIVLIGSFATLALSVFWNSAGTSSTETILTMFTSVVGFLAGLFAPSPLSKNNHE